MKLYPKRSGEANCVTVSENGVISERAGNRILRKRDLGVKKLTSFHKTHLPSESDSSFYVILHDGNKLTVIERDTLTSITSLDEVARVEVGNFAGNYQRLTKVYFSNGSTEILDSDSVDSEEESEFEDQNSVRSLEFGLKVSENAKVEALRSLNEIDREIESLCCALTSENGISEQSLIANLIGKERMKGQNEERTKKTEVAVEYSKSNFTNRDVREIVVKVTSLTEEKLVDLDVTLDHGRAKSGWSFIGSSKENVMVDKGSDYTGLFLVPIAHFFASDSLVVHVNFQNSVGEIIEETETFAIGDLVKEFQAQNNASPDVLDCVRSVLCKIELAFSQSDKNFLQGEICQKLSLEPRDGFLIDKTENVIVKVGEARQVTLATFYAVSETILKAFLQELCKRLDPDVMSLRMSQKSEEKRTETSVLKEVINSELRMLFDLLTCEKKASSYSVANLTPKEKFAKMHQNMESTISMKASGYQEFVSNLQQLQASNDVKLST